MRAGDVMIWHHWCAHASSYNGSDTVRQAVISRFHTTAYAREILLDDGCVSCNTWLPDMFWHGILMWLNLAMHVVQRCGE